MKIQIEREVLERYPDAEIGYLVAQVSVKNSDTHVDALKRMLGKDLADKGINATNFVIHPSLSKWRKIYEDDFQVNAKTYRSSIEALVRRIVTGKEIWNINSVVDLYNCCSVFSLLPMGGYDLKKISGTITIRFASEQEPFYPLGAKEKIEAKSNHVVYADDQRVICWLWNHKDARETCIDEDSETVIFFIDSFESAGLQKALSELAEHLKKIGGIPSETGILNKASPAYFLSSSIS